MKEIKKGFEEFEGIFGYLRNENSGEVIGLNMQVLVKGFGW